MIQRAGGARRRGGKPLHRDVHAPELPRFRPLRHFPYRQEPSTGIRVHIVDNPSIMSNSSSEYDRFGESFARSRKSMRWEEVDFLCGFLDSFSEPSNVLDVGC